MGKSHYISRLLIIAILFLFACKKDKKVLDAAVQDPDDVLGATYSDTATMIAFTIDYDSIASFNDGVKFLGSNQDPVFGRTDVGLYTKFSLPNNITNVSFGDDANLVSAELILPITELNFTGNYQSILNYKVYQMTKNVDAGATYYTNNDTLYDLNTLIGSYTGSVSVKDGLFVIRIPIDHAYAEAMLQNPAYLLNNTVFQNTYKGFYITTSSTNLDPVNKQGVISKFNLDHYLAGFYFYYQNGPISTTKETKTFQFPFNGTDVARFNRVDYKPSSGGSILLNHQLNGDSLIGNQGLFLKGLGGSKIKIKFPYLLNYVKDHKISINKAELVFKVDESLGGSDVNYLPPDKLAILGIDSLSREIYTMDQFNSLDFSRYGGTYDPVNKEYVFNIAREFQLLMNGRRTNNGFYLVVADGDRLYTVRRDDRAGRVVLAGTSNQSLKPVLRLTYIPYLNDN